MQNTPPETLTDAIKTVLDEVPKTVHLINPTPTLLSEFIHHAYTRESTPTIRIFATQQTFDTTFTTFKTATKAAELAENDSIAFRVATFDTPPTIIYDNTVLALIHHHILEDTHQQLATNLHEFISGKWESTSPYTFNTPTLSTIYKTINDTFGNTALLDTKALFDAADTTPFTAPALALLIAIRHNYTMADISNWAESINLTTNGTLSRYCAHLESKNLITTTPAETTTKGRPPLTLSPTTDQLTETPETALKTITPARQTEPLPSRSR